jgi:WD40 repeat protein
MYVYIFTASHYYSQYIYITNIHTYIHICICIHIQRIRAHGDALFAGYYFSLLFSLPPSLCVCVSVCIDGKWVVSGDEDGLVRVWDLSAGKQLYEYAHEGVFLFLLYIYIYRVWGLGAGKQWSVSGVYVCAGKQLYEYAR